MSSAAEQLYEQVLVLRYQAGDDRALVELVERYDGRLRYYVRRLLDDAEATDDVLQSVWLAVVRGLKRLARPAALSVWLYRIARNEVFARRRGRRDWAELTEEPAAPAADEDAREFAAEDAVRIHAALAELRPEHREVLVLRFVEDMSYEGIAAVTDCPVGTVRSRIHYARHALRRAMGGAEHDQS